MSRYLTNVAIEPGLTRADYAAATQDAARKAGVRIAFRHHAMPGSRDVPGDPGVGSLYLADGGSPDLSEFWSLYSLALTRIRAEREEPA